MEDWLLKWQGAQKTCYIAGGTKKLHIKFTDGKELAEEYNMDTGAVTRRAWKQNSSLTSEPEWVVEVGECVPPGIPQLMNIQETNTAPSMSKRLTRECLEWRIRNLPYPIETYEVVADNTEHCIIVKTTNKKFYKKIPVPDLLRLGLPIQQDTINVSHKFNTLIISYKKPAQMKAMEKLMLEEVNKLEAVKENPLECNPS